MVGGECLIYDSWPSETLKTVWGIIIIFIQFFIPFFILLFCYGKIAWMMSKRIQMDDFSCNKSNNDGNEIKEDKKVSCKMHRKINFNWPEGTP